MPDRQRGVFLGALLLAAFQVSVGAQEPPPAHAVVPVIGGPCEGCDAVFDGMPDTLGPVARIAPPGEPGAPMRIHGTVYDRHGDPAPGIIVYAYHTNARGVYPRTERMRGQPRYRHGMLRGWVRTDSAGRYRFDTIRPGAYPNGDTPQHVHMHVVEPGCCTYYIASVRFTDDPRLSEEEKGRERHDPRGGTALATPTRDADGAWVVTRDITLGAGVPDDPGP